MANPGGTEIPIEPSSNRSLLLARVSLIVAVLIAYSPLFNADFSRWDDAFNIAENPRLSPPTFQSVSFYWRHEAFDLYIPVTFSVWAILAKCGYVAEPDVNGWHQNPYIFHGANVLAHVGSVLLVFAILRKIVPRPLRAAWIGAMLFALHPVQAESVGWISGLKDVLAGAFTFAALRLYLQDGSPARQRGCFAAAIFISLIAMLCKPVAMMAPLMAATIDWILVRRSARQIAVRFASWFPVAVACAIVARISQPPRYSELFVLPLMRPLVAGDAITIYLWKLCWPISLGIDYGRLPANVLGSHIAYFTCLVPIALAAALWFCRRKCPLAAVAGAMFVIGLLPVLGLFPFDFQRYSTVADHYLYLPMLGVSMAAASFVAAWPGRRTITIAAIVLTLLGIRTFLQTRYWKDSFSLFTHAVQVNPQSWAMRHNLAVTLLGAGDLAEAEKQARMALQIKPDYGEANANLAQILQMKGDIPGAVAAAKRATDVEPGNPSNWSWLGNALSAAGRSNEAIEAYRRAVAIDPDNSKAQINLGSALAEHGDFAEAISRYQTALQIDPTSPEALDGFKRATAEQNQRATTKANLRTN